jgi:cation:H+ antiporter
LGSSVYNVAVVLGITVMTAPAEVQIPDDVVAPDLVAAYLSYLVWLILV